jgi:hypothetical protein
MRPQLDRIQLQSIISNININTSTTSTTSSATTTIFWEEVFTSNCQINDKLNTIFQVWTDSSIVSEITTAGYQIIASPSSYWYSNTGSNIILQ